MRDQSLEHGLPVLAGDIKGACRHQAKDRMDINEERWGAWNGVRSHPQATFPLFINRMLGRCDGF